MGEVENIAMPMSMSTMQLSIIIPAYKEAEKLPRDVAAADNFLQQYHISGEILLVDDGSPDGTAEAARRLQVKYPSLRVISYARNRGKGHAVAQGVARAKGQYVLFADAGLCVPYDIALLGMKMLDLNMCDLAYGSRRMRGSVLREQPAYRRIGSQIYGVVVHAFMGIPRYISDTQCGFKLYRADAARKLYSELVTDGFMFDTEIILRSIREGYRLLEFPVLWSNDADTRYDPVRGTIRNFQELWHIKMSLMGEPREIKVHSEGREDVQVT